MDASLRWIEGQRDLMRSSVEAWAAINSGSYHPAGIAAVAREVAGSPLVETLGASIELRDLPAIESIDDRGEVVAYEPAGALVLRTRPDAARRVLLAIHLDTVFEPDHAFQEVTELDSNTIGGPGVADAKGGVAVLLTALSAFERSDVAESLGWTVVLNPDEEIGSPCSAGLLRDLAREADYGLVFEPSLPDGSLIKERKGSGNFTLVVRGKAAHVGRAFAEGRHAIHALADMIDRVAALGGGGTIANTGFITGGGPVNVVPEFALARVNMRVDDAKTQGEVEERLRAFAAEVAAAREVSIEVHGGFLSPPKPQDEAMERLMREIERCGAAVGVDVGWKTSGGVCDGNKLAAAGLPNVDTLGPQGGDIHSAREYLLLDSLVPRAQLCAAMLDRTARGLFVPDFGPRNSR